MENGAVRMNKDYVKEVYENETTGNRSASVTGYAKFRCNKCKEIVTRNLGWKHWTPSFCEKTGLDARLYRITAPAKTENDIQYIA